MALQMEQSIQWNHQSVTQVFKSLTHLFKVEVTSILELALWKMKISNSILDEPSQQQQVDRESCRMICKGDYVISNVVGFLCDESSSATAISSNFLPNAYHIISMEEI